MPCNVTDAPHESVRQNFNLSSTWDLCNVFEKLSCFLKQYFWPMDASIAFKLG